MPIFEGMEPARVLHHFCTTASRDQRAECAADATPRDIIRQQVEEDKGRDWIFCHSRSVREEMAVSYFPLCHSANDSLEGRFLQDDGVSEIDAMALQQTCRGVLQTISSSSDYSESTAKAFDELDCADAVSHIVSQHDQWHDLVMRPALTQFETRRPKFLQQPTWEFVIVRCREKLSFLTELLCSVPDAVGAVLVTIVDKCGKHADQDLQLRRQPRCPGTELGAWRRVVKYRFAQQENYGFETMVYLSSMLASRAGDIKKVPNTTFFLQADPFDHLAGPEHRHNFFELVRTLPLLPETKHFGALSDAHKLESGKHGVSWWSGSGGSSTFCDMYAALVPRPDAPDYATRATNCLPLLGLFRMSSFYLSAERLFSRPVEWYQRALRLLTDPDEAAEWIDHSNPNWAGDIDWTSGQFINNQVNDKEACSTTPSNRSLCDVGRHPLFAFTKHQSLVFEHLWHLFFEEEAVVSKFASRDLVPSLWPSQWEADRSMYLVFVRHLASTEPRLTSWALKHVAVGWRDPSSRLASVWHVPVVEQAGQSQAPPVEQSAFWLYQDFQRGLEESVLQHMVLLAADNDTSVPKASHFCILWAVYLGATTDEVIGEALRAGLQQAQNNPAAKFTETG